MNADVQSLPPAAVNTKPLWVAIGGLGIAVLALGAGLVYVQTRPADGHAALAALETAAPTAADQNAAGALPVATVAANEAVLAPVPAPLSPKPTPTKVSRPKSAVAATDPAAPAPATTPVVVAAAPAAKPYVVKTVCASCGTVESVTPITREGTTQGVGAVAGGVLGAVVGNQVGGGSGRALATILGAVGGGVAGNAIEKNIKKETVFHVRVRMEDGSSRTLEQAHAPAVGARVIVEGNTLHHAVDNSGVITTSAAPQV